MNYKKLLNEILAWTGVEKQYWKAVEILIHENMLTENEIKTCKLGLTCYTGDLVTSRLKELAEFCKSKIPPEQPDKGKKHNSQNNKSSKI